MKRNEWHRIFKEELFPNFSPQILVEKYSRQVDIILEALGDINPHFRESLISDKSTFESFEPIGLGDKELKLVSSKLGIKLNHSDKIVDVAKFIS